MGRLYQLSDKGILLMENQAMTRALFLDRDGVLNRELGHYVTWTQDFEILPTVPQALRQAADAGFLLIIISNQGGVAKGLYGMEDVWAMQRKLEEALSPLGVTLAEGYYCPHHPDHGRCLCRKPGSFMLEKAIARFGIDPSRSYLIGDSERDILAAEAVGVRGLLMESNSPLIDTLQNIL